MPKEAVPGTAGAVGRMCVRALLTLVWIAGLAFYLSSLTSGNPVRSTIAGLCLFYLALWGLILLWSDASLVETTGRFVLTTLSIGLVVGTLELLVLTRLVDFRVVFEIPTDEPWRNPRLLRDPKLLHIYKPHEHFRWAGIEYRYDRHGLRNASDLRTANLVVIGDSFIEGVGIEAPDLVTSQLARLTGRSVANLGQSWYGPQQELELLRRYGLPLQPETCIWCFYEGNDLRDIMRYEMATRDWKRFSSQLHSFRQRSFTRNAVLALRSVSYELHGGAPSVPPPPNLRGLVQASSGKTEMIFIDKGLYLSAGDHAALRRLPPILREAYQLCDSGGAEFLLVYIPTKFRVYRRITAFDAEAEPLYWVLNDLPARLERIVRENMPRARFLDLTPVMTEAARRGELVYGKGFDTHWTPEGERVAATAIAGALGDSTSTPAPPEGLPYGEPADHVGDKW